MKSLVTFAVALFCCDVQGVIISGQQVSSTEWTYTVTYEPWDNYAVCPPPGDVATITLTGLSGVVYASPPTSTDIHTVTSDTNIIDVFNQVNLAWVPEVWKGGTEVRWTHFHPGTGNWAFPIRVFGFRVVTIAPAVSGGVTAFSEGFSTDVSVTGPCPVQGADGRDFGGTVEGPIAIPMLEVVVDIKPGVFPNRINPKSAVQGELAILSMPGFDAPGQVVLDSLTFGRTGNERSVGLDARAEDVNGDGLIDLICYFRCRLTGFQRGDSVGKLKGQTTDGTTIEGVDSIAIVTTPVMGRGGEGRPAFPGRGRL